ncbi:MAG: hypothetical protein KDB50_01020 [Mycobacterium sp.]|nr:hypothetical protein [Mycobacterium sp.]
MTDPNQGNPTEPSRPDSGGHAIEAAESYAGPGRKLAWIAPVALAVGVIGTLLALWAIKTASDNAPLARAGDSKVRVCSAFSTVSKAVQLQTNGGAEPLPEALAATNSRQALLGGGDYLVQQLDAHTPRDLADAVTAFADNIQVLGLNYLGGAVATDAAQAELIKQADATMTQVADLCS